MNKQGFFYLTVVVSFSGSENFKMIHFILYPVPLMWCVFLFCWGFKMFGFPTLKSPLRFSDEEVAGIAMTSTSEKRRRDFKIGKPNKIAIFSRKVKFIFPYHEFFQVSLCCGTSNSKRFILKKRKSFLKSHFMFRSDEVIITRQFPRQFRCHRFFEKITWRFESLWTLRHYKVFPSSLNVRNHTQDIDGVNVMTDQSCQSWQKSYRGP